MTEEICCGTFASTCGKHIVNGCWLVCGLVVWLAVKAIQRLGWFFRLSHKVFQWSSRLSAWFESLGGIGSTQQ